MFSLVYFTVIFADAESNFVVKKWLNYKIHWILYLVAIDAVIYCTFKLYYK